MLKKVLIAEDQSMTSYSITKTMEDLGITTVQYTYYCDDALMLVGKALQVEEPFDLLITDLSFAEDHRKQTLLGGGELVEAVRALQTDIKVLVFSAESRPAVISSLFDRLNINGYVLKGRNDAVEFKAAMDAIAKGKKHMPPSLRKDIKQKNSFEFSELDVTILSQLLEGTKQKDIPGYLQANNIRPSGLSSVEKRLSIMREVFGFSNNEQLIAYCKDFGII